MSEMVARMLEKATIRRAKSSCEYNKDHLTLQSYIVLTRSPWLLFSLLVMILSLAIPMIFKI